MRNIVLIHLLFFFLSIISSLRGETTGTLPPQPAMTVSSTWLYPDSSLSAASNVSVKEGALLEILQKSLTESLDKSQNQQYHWYNVRLKDGQTGWIFGDALAEYRETALLPEHLRPFQRKQVSLGSGFEDAVLWFGAIEGHDAKEYHNVFYGEYYLIATNAAGKCTFLRIAGESAQGMTSLRQLLFYDVTGDGKPELILESGSRELTDKSEVRNLDVYSLQNGNLFRVFNENMTLNDAEGLPSPALYKCIDVENKTLRVEYVDYMSCKDYSLPYLRENNSTAREECLEYVTYSFLWNNRSNQFEVFYEPSRSAPTVMPTNFGISLRKEPSLSGEVVCLLSAEDKLLVLKQYDKITKYNKTTKLEPYLYVRTSKGQMGYVAASKVTWQKKRHAKILEAYSDNPPLLRNNWAIDFPFIRVIEVNRPVGSSN